MKQKTYYNSLCNYNGEIIQYEKPPLSQNAGHHTRQSTFNNNKSSSYCRGQQHCSKMTDINLFWGSFEAFVTLWPKWRFGRAPLSSSCVVDVRFRVGLDSARVFAYHSATCREAMRDTEETRYQVRSSIDMKHGKCAVTCA